MIQRQCPECSSELVQVRRRETLLAPGIAALPSLGWHCSVCGREFTAEQIRESKRTKSTAAAHP